MSYEPENPTSEIGDNTQRWLFDEFTRIKQEFILLRQENAALVDLFVLAGYGGLRLNTPVAGPDILVDTWQILTQFDTILTATPRYVQQDLTNNGIVVERAGMWNITLNLEFGHGVEQADNRQLEIQLYNATDAVGGSAILIAETGLKDEFTSYPISFPIEILPANIDKLYQVRIRGRGTFSEYNNVVWNIQSFSAFHVSQAQE